MVKIFGGNDRCDLIAEGIIGAVAGEGIKLPVVVRLEGNRAKEAGELFQKSGLNIIAINDLTGAAQRIVNEVRA
jgi:succinyl-CoA synthetase beta subunit